MQDIKSMTPEELRAYLKELGQPDFRAKQIFRWLHKPVTSFDEMSNLPKKLRFQLAQECFLSVMFMTMVIVGMKINLMINIKFGIIKSIQLVHL